MISPVPIPGVVGGDAEFFRSGWKLHINSEMLVRAHHWRFKEHFLRGGYCYCFRSLATLLRVGVDPENYDCTARGTGDDCFAIWPATYTAQTYSPGLNVITHCTGQLAFLANGGATYGGGSNRIEDCPFQDSTYGCGILISTTFPVTNNGFTGTTVAQRCDLSRCGGYDPGWTWRAALQLCLHSSSLSGVNLNNLNITNSISDGLSIIAPGSSISNYGIGTGGRHGLWARYYAIGSMTVSHSAVAEYRDDSPHFAFNFVTNEVPPAQEILTISVNGDASVTLTYAVTPGFPYHLEMATNLSPATWTTVAGSPTNAAVDTVTFTDLYPPAGGRCYYRTSSP